MGRPTYEEVTGGLTEEQIQEVFKPLICQSSTVYQYWGE